jgi:hypothetical protein
MIRQTQKERVLNYLKTFKTITSLECVYRLNIVDLQKSIQLLRKEGYKITDTIEHNDTSWWKRYKLED